MLGNSNKGHRCMHDENGKPYFRLYTVYDNRTDYPIIAGATAREAAEAMGVTYSSFHSLVTKAAKGIVRKWTFIVEFADDDEEDENDDF